MQTLVLFLKLIQQIVNFSILTYCISTCIMHINRYSLKIHAHQLYEYMAVVIVHNE